MNALVLAPVGAGCFSALRESPPVAPGWRRTFFHLGQQKNVTAGGARPAGCTGSNRTHPAEGPKHSDQEVQA